jgi:hypothetical protein
MSKVRTALNGEIAATVLLAAKKHGLLKNHGYEVSVSVALNLLLVLSNQSRAASK